MDSGEHARLHRVYRDLIALRHNEPDLADPWLEHLGVEFDEDRQWFAMRRGSLVIACNINAEPVSVPFVGDVVLAWDSPETKGDKTILEGHSFAILRRSSS